MRLRNLVLGVLVNFPIHITYDELIVFNFKPYIHTILLFSGIIYCCVGVVQGCTTTPTQLVETVNLQRQQLVETISGTSSICQKLSIKGICLSFSNGPFAYYINIHCSSDIANSISSMIKYKLTQRNFKDLSDVRLSQTTPILCPNLSNIQQTALPCIGRNLVQILIFNML